MTRHSKRCVMLISLCLGAACAGTETDNPIADGPIDPGPPPSYQSPVDLYPQQSSIPPCAPQLDSKPTRRPLWAQADGWLVGAARRGVLSFIDVQDAATPTVAAEVPFAGEPMELSVEAGGAAMLVLAETEDLRSDDVPEPTTLGATTKLVRFELSASDEPQRVAEVALEGEYWRMFRRGEVYWVMSARPRDPVALCDLGPFSCGHVSRDAILLTGYRFDAGELSQVQRVELPTTFHAWAAGDGFVTFVADGGDAAGGVLHLVRFEADGRLGEPTEVRVASAPFELAPMDLSGDLLRLFGQRSVVGGTALQLYDLAAEPPALLASVPANLDHVEGIRFLDTAVYVPASAATGALRIDHADATAPTAEPFEAPTQLVWPLSVTAEGAGDDGLAMGLMPEPASDGLVLSLLERTGGELQVLDTLSLDNAGAGDLGRLAEQLQVDAGQLWVPTRDGLRAVRFDGDVLVLREPSLATGQRNVVVAGDAAFAAGRYGLDHVDLASATSAHLAWPGYEDVQAHVQAGDYDAALVRQRDGRMELWLRKGEAPVVLDVPPVADKLLEAGEHLLVVSTWPVSECQQSGFDCAGYAPGVEVVSLTGEPRVVAHVDLPEVAGAGDPANGDGLQWPQAEDFEGLRLADGRYVFVGELDQTCWSDAECEAIGVEAGSLTGANVAPTGVAVDCAPAPATPPGQPAAPPVVCQDSTPPPGAYGRKRQQRFYLLDHAADPPRFEAPIVTTLENPDSRFASPRVSGQTVLATRLEKTGDAPGVPPGTPGARGAAARFMLERFVAEPGAALEALPALNVPGFPITLDAERGERASDAAGPTLVTIEAAADDSGELVVYALELIGDGAHVRHQERLAAELDDYIAHGDHVYVLRHESQGCAATTTLQPLAIDGLALGDGLELPGEGYFFAGVGDGKLLLEGPLGSFIVVELAHPSAPEVAAFLRPAPLLFKPQFSDGLLLGASYGGGRHRIEL